MTAQPATDAPIFPGFDPRWRDAPDFVLGVTGAIWDHRDVAALERHHARDAILRAPAGIAQGGAALVAATLATIAAFPDARLLTEDVIWCPTAPAAAGGRSGFLAAQRLTRQATHAGAGVYGPPSGRAVAQRVMAEWWCADDRICDAWVVPDESAVLRALGHDPRDWAAALIDREGGPEHCLRPLTPDTDPEGPYAGRGTRTPVSDRLEAVLKRLMDGEMAPIATEYDRACELAYPGGIAAMGHAAAERFWLGLRSALPSAAFRVEHRIGLEEPGQPPRAALRWSLYGRHDGPGVFGPPTGAYLYVLGMTHAEFGPRGLRREWTLIDETAIWKQILLATG